MPELQITIQILTIIVLVLFSVVLGYVIYMLHKLSSKLDTLLQIIGYYEKVQAVLKDIANGPGKTYIEIFKTIMSFVAPLLTNNGKAK